VFFNKDNMLLEVGAHLEKIGDDFYLHIGTNRFNKEIYITIEDTGNGGSKPVTHCPYCGEKIIKLFLSPPYFNEWKCRKCHDLTYASSKHSSRPSAHDNRMAARIGVSPKEFHRIINLGYRKDRLDNYFTEQIYTEETKMVSTSLKLSKRQVRELDKLSAEFDLPKSELIRRAIDLFLEKEKLKAVQLKSLGE